MPKNMNKIYKYNLASNSWGNEELLAIQKVIDNDYFTMGSMVDQFEIDFARKFGSRYAVMVNSGSSANLLVFAALSYKKNNPLQPGDEVIVPSLSWATTYYPIHQYGMKLVFVDIDLYSLNMDFNLLESALSERTRAIFVPNILGNPANLLEIQAFCQKHNLYLLEDNCESMGAKLKGKYTGTFGICGTFSTFFSHHISTMEGGMIVTDDEEIYHLLLCLRAHGWSRQLPLQNKVCVKSTDSFYESYRFILPGYNVRPLEMSGAIGIAQLKKLDRFLQVRRENARIFQRLFANDERFILQAENDTSSWFGFSIVIKKDSAIARDRVVEILEAAGIEVRPIVTGNFLKNDVIHHLNHRVVGDHKNAQYVHEQGFFVGNHQFNIDDGLEYLSKTLANL